MKHPPVLLLSVILSGFGVLPAHGQVTTMVPGGPLQPVTYPSVDPNRLPSSGPYNITFYVVNIDTLPHAGEFTCSATGPVTCGTVNPSNGSVAAGDSIAVAVTYSTTASTGAASVVLTATPEPGLPASAAG